MGSAAGPESQPAAGTCGSGGDPSSKCCRGGAQRAASRPPAPERSAGFEARVPPDPGARPWQWTLPRLRVILTPASSSLPSVLRGGRKEKQKRSKNKKTPPETNHLYILWKENIFVDSYSFIIMRVRSGLSKRFQMDTPRPA